MPLGTQLCLLSFVLVPTFRFEACVQERAINSRRVKAVIDYYMPSLSDVFAAYAQVNVWLLRIQLLRVQSIHTGPNDASPGVNWLRTDWHRDGDGTGSSRRQINILRLRPR